MGREDGLSVIWTLPRDEARDLSSQEPFDIFEHIRGQKSGAHRSKGLS